MKQIYKNMIDRFLKYVKVDTASDAESITSPSTKRQLAFGKDVVKEMVEMGLLDAHIDENGVIMATIPANTTNNIPVIGFVAHLDVVNSVPSANVKPQIFNNYQGGDLVLNKEQNIILSATEYPVLNDYVGQDIITSDGTTLLGADNKAGMVEILAMAEYLLNNNNVKHGTIKIAFTPDEEIGRGTVNFDVKKFGADYGYTVDGGKIGGVDYENFNAATAKIKINGINIHPGSAKNKMKSALLIAMELNAMLPVNQRPAFTERYEGFYHLTNLKGNVDSAEMTYIVRDHDRTKFENKKQLMQQVAKFLNDVYGEGTVDLNLMDSYRNMSEKIVTNMHLIDNACEALKRNDIEPIIEPIRGGSDGARLSFMGLPCPNLFTGGHNFHGKKEFIPIQSMEKAVDVLIDIVKIYSK
ncbi:peptidase T [Clostridium sp. 'deep sea']|uniref:peptidase T n=1 Tax=Clostridium sp. 'deep sea' TaxID=2779445 RepID=UPI0018968A0F|nr:peptidase T [Clostridium sp. 'deep sea']QOR36465.1 peptidase T [Clostridium sp. 'deep sea']